MEKDKNHEIALLKQRLKSKEEVCDLRVRCLETEKVALELRLENANLKHEVERKELREEITRLKANFAP